MFHLFLQFLVLRSFVRQLQFQVSHFGHGRRQLPLKHVLLVPQRNQFFSCRLVSFLRLFRLDELLTQRVRFLIAQTSSLLRNGGMLVRLQCRSLTLPLENLDCLGIAIKRFLDLRLFLAPLRHHFLCRSRTGHTLQRHGCLVLGRLQSRLVLVLLVQFGITLAPHLATLHTLEPQGNRLLGNKVFAHRVHAKLLLDRLGGPCLTHRLQSLAGQESTHHRLGLNDLVVHTEVTATPQETTTNRLDLHGRLVPLLCSNPLDKIKGGLTQKHLCLSHLDTRSKGPIIRTTKDWTNQNLRETSE
mmetsp:Transcript_20863/g.48183  ORF Transcript_20863/g.48183 Transcript_20863/m.48183 type:complete len:300 (+) Transcript_20863:394-1293(+)